MISKILIAYNFFLKGSYEFNIPKKKDILIFDSVGSEYICEYLKKYDFSVMETRGGVINIYVLIMSLLKIKIFLSNPIKSYLFSYIKCTSPKIVITFIDNSYIFYEISSYFPNIKTIFIQNGIRDEVFFHMLPTKKTFKVDHMLVINDAFGKLYKKKIAGDTETIGFFKSNLYEVKKKENDNKYVLFISQYINKIDSKIKSLYLKDRKPFEWCETLQNEIKLIKLVDLWCKQNLIKLIVAGGEGEFIDEEYDYYKKHLKLSDWDFINTNKKNSYDQVDQAEVVITLDSTLGYESLVRGNKTLFFATRKYEEQILYPFGWPIRLDSEGFFWTTHSDKKEFDRIMNQIFNLEKNRWEKLLSQLNPDLFIEDSGNIKFNLLLKNILKEKQTC